MTHADIIKDPDSIAQQLGVSVHTVRSWRQRKSIPSDQWSALIAAGFATLEQLAPDLAEVIRPQDAA